MTTQHLDSECDYQGGLHRPHHSLLPDSFALGLQKVSVDAVSFIPALCGDSFDFTALSYNMESRWGVGGGGVYIYIYIYTLFYRLDWWGLEKQEEGGGTKIS